MTGTDSIGSTAGSSGVARFMPPEELAMQALTKQLYKSCMFRGIYLERCFVEQIGGYRDVIALQRSERDLEKQLLSSAVQLQMFYQRFVPNMWVGITKGSVGNYKHSTHPIQLDTCIWTELNDLAFGEYWFSVKTLRFRAGEVQLKLKIIRAVETNPFPTPQRSLALKNETNQGDSAEAIVPDVHRNSRQEQAPTIGLDDFLAILQQWRESIVTTTFEFMAKDINKRNIMSAIRFLGLLLFSICGGAVVALRFLGIFAVRFLFEVSRLTHTVTPIVFKLIEFLNKIVGAFFILLTMIWKDLVVNRRRPTPEDQPLEASQRFKHITYAPSTHTHRRSPRYSSINYR